MQIEDMNWGQRLKVKSTGRIGTVIAFYIGPPLQVCLKPEIEDGKGIYKHLYELDDVEPAEE